MTKVSSKAGPATAERMRNESPSVDKLSLILHPAWKPFVRPAPATRRWMDETAESFAYRCLPLNIANSHGWEFLTACGFSAEWNGGRATTDITVTPDRIDGPNLPVSIFGYGVLTFHVQALIRTPPGWNIYVTGSPNDLRDGIAPLSGVIEADWSPYSFTMNWKFTRPGSIRFEAGEPFLFFFPVERGGLRRFEPRVASFAEEPEVADQFQRWSRSRDAFRVEIEDRLRKEPVTPSEKWQKRYYRGVDMDDRPGVADHEARLRLPVFPGLRTEVDGATVGGGSIARASVQTASLSQSTDIAREHLTLIGRDLLMGETDDVLVATLVSAGMTDERARRTVAETRRAPLADVGCDIGRQLRRREWIMRADVARKRRHGRLSGIDRHPQLSRESFLRDYLGLNLPVAMPGVAATWPAVRHWTPASLASVIGDREVEVVSGPHPHGVAGQASAENAQRMMFPAFLRDAMDFRRTDHLMLRSETGAINRAALTPLHAGMTPLPAVLEPNATAASAALWMEASGSFTALHHDLDDQLMVQMVGRRIIKLVPPAEVWRLGDRSGRWSDVRDIDDALADPERKSALEGLIHFDVLIGPGDALFIPVGWWQQSRTLDFTVSAAFAYSDETADHGRAAYRTV